MLVIVDPWCATGPIGHDEKVVNWRRFMFRLVITNLVEIRGVCRGYRDFLAKLTRQSSLRRFAALDLAADKVPAVWIGCAKMCPSTKQRLVSLYQDRASILGCILSAAHREIPLKSAGKLVAEPRATVLVLIPEDLYVQVGAR